MGKEPDVKESLGGLRDGQILDWLRLSGNGRPAGDVEPADTGLLLLVRTALHRASGTASNRLTLELQRPVADVMGLDGPGRWTPGDWLLRQTYDAVSRFARAAKLQPEGGPLCRGQPGSEWQPAS